MLLPCASHLRYLEEATENKMNDLLLSRQLTSLRIYLSYESHRAVTRCLPRRYAATKTVNSTKFSTFSPGILVRQ
jgi:hypothetical protein